jgi:hypothetical protein
MRMQQTIIQSHGATELGALIAISLIDKRASAGSADERNGGVNLKLFESDEGESLARNLE